MDYKKKISLKAILLGILIELCLYAIFLVAIVGVLASQNTFLTEGVNQTHLVVVSERVAILVVWALLCLLVGYVTGCIAKTSEVLNAGIVGSIFAIYSLRVIGQSPLWFDLLGLLSTVLFHLLGGFLAQRLRMRISRVAAG